jgi:hypothetical protein
MTPPSPGWPVFAAPVLRDVAAAFQRRRKAIGYHGRLSCGQEFSETATGSHERLNLDYESLPGLQLRLSLWEDGTLWLRACIRRPGTNQGWAFLDHFYGTWHDLAPSELVENFEATILVCSGAVPAEAGERLRALWRTAGPSPG